MSRGAKIVIGLAVGFGLLILLCCGGGIWFAYYTAKSTMSTDPDVIASRSSEITQIDIPDGLQPQASFDMKIPFTDNRVMLWTVYGDEQANNQLVLMAFGEATTSGNPDEMRRGMEQSLRQQGVGEQQDIQVAESYTKQVEIRGEQATFTISKGTAQGSDSPRIQVVGVFQGETGPSMLMFNGDADKYSEDDVIEMIESIR